MTPAEIALAAVLRAWHEWAGGDGMNETGDALRDIGDVLHSCGLAAPDDSLTQAGASLLERDDLRRIDNEGAA